MVQSLAQLSLLTALPSSHASPASTTPSPQKVQSLRQALPFGGCGPPGGSQVSPGSSTPLPQGGGSVQSLWQPSLSTALPSSHASPPLTTPSPQKVQSARQALPFGGSAVPGGSQLSPGSRLPSPQAGGGGSVQSLRQPSLLIVLPSSHCSVPFRTPSPQ